MADLTHTRIEEIAPYHGANAIPGIRFRPVGRALGVTAWGMNVLELDAGCTEYPEHDHQRDGQEEVYVVLKGSGVVQADGEETAIAAGSMVRAGPAQKRKFVPGPDGITLLAIGGTPGMAYAPRR